MKKIDQPGLPLTRAIERKPLVPGSTGTYRTLAGVPMTSSEPVLRTSLWGEQYLEILCMDEGCVDLEFANSGRMPLLFGHDGSRNVGIVEENSVRIEVHTDGYKRLIGDLAIQEGLNKDADEVIRSIEADGAQRSVSIGWDYPGNGLTIREPRPEEHVKYGEDLQFVAEFRMWEPRENSFTPIPAVTSVGVGRSEKVQHQRQVVDQSKLETIFNQRRQTAQTKGATPMKPQDPNNPGGGSGERTVAANPNPGTPSDAELQSQRMQASLEALQYVRENRANWERMGLTREAIDALEKRTSDERLNTAAVSRAALDAIAAASSAANATSVGTTPTRSDDNVDQSDQFAAILTRHKRPFSVNEAIRQAKEGSLRSGDTPESDVHLAMVQERAKVPGLPKLAPNDVALDLRSVMADPVFASAIQQRARALGIDLKMDNRVAGRRVIEIGTTPTGVWTPTFDEAGLIDTLYPRTGILGLVDVMPGLATQNFSVPRETGRFAFNMVGEKGARGDQANTGNTVVNDDSAPDYSTNLTFARKTGYCQVLVTDEAMAQSAFVYGRLLRRMGIDVPRGIDNQILNGSGAGANTKGILTHTSTDGVGVVASATNGVKPSIELLNELMTLVDDADASEEGQGYFFARSSLRRAIANSRRYDVDGGGSKPLADWDGVGMDRRLYFDEAMIVKDNHLPKNVTQGTATNTTTLLYCIPSLVKLVYFSGFMLKVDPYTEMESGQTRIQVQQMFDFQLEHPQGFAYQKGIIPELRVANDNTRPTV